MDNALVCHTDDSTCCRGVDDPPYGVGRGEWYLPDETVGIPSPVNTTANVLKVENVCYTLKIRGSEVPEHMLVHVLTTSYQDNNITASESEQF